MIPLHQNVCQAAIASVSRAAGVLLERAGWTMAGRMRYLAACSCCCLCTVLAFECTASWLTLQKWQKNMSVAKEGVALYRHNESNCSTLQCQKSCKGEGKRVWRGEHQQRERLWDLPHWGAVNFTQLFCEPMPLMGGDQAGEQDLCLLIVVGFLNVTHRFINSFFLQAFPSFPGYWN